MLLVDPYTKEKFVPRRTNQKYANQQNRIRHNNLKAKEQRDEKAFCDRPLLINYRILHELMKGKKIEIFHHQFLKGRGFADNVTNVDEHEGRKCFCVYHFLVVYLEKEKVKIIRND